MAYCLLQNVKTINIEYTNTSYIKSNSLYQTAV